ncbi:MAG: hypothetical protein HY917_05610 [Candidatus Diapherotrites archaeon]|nr:hypothetical protein [Candidatus Diapherotrites archaeon]
MPNPRRIVPFREQRKGKERKETNFSLVEEQSRQMFLSPDAGSTANAIGGNFLKKHPHAFGVKEQLPPQKGLEYIGAISYKNGPPVYWYADRRKKDGTVFNRKQSKK